MKLFTKYSRINLIATVIIFLLASAAFSLLLRYVLISQIDEDLRIEKNEIDTYVGEFHKLPAIIKVHDQITEYIPVATPSNITRKFYTTVKATNSPRHRDELLRQIKFNVNVNGQWYLFTVSKSLEGTDDLIRSILVITLATILLILIAAFLINRIVLRRLWQPFYNSLRVMGLFKLTNPGAIDFDKSNIDEFVLLNDSLRSVLNKAKQDYLLLKEFTENASHELQTPLAVIRSKLDILIQDENLSATQGAAIQGAYDAISKLSRMNQSLLLLAKIENKQFSEATGINLKELVENKLQQFRELWHNGNIALTVSMEDCSIVMNNDLADVMLNNLLTNATRYNIYNGNIRISLKQGEFIIANTGAPKPLDEERLFSRFYKTVSTGDNNGLGLSIVKQICGVSGCTITYGFEKTNKHIFKLNW